MLVTATGLPNQCICFESREIQNAVPRALALFLLRIFFLQRLTLTRTVMKSEFYITWEFFSDSLDKDRNCLHLLILQESHIIYSVLSYLANIITSTVTFKTFIARYLFFKHTTPVNQILVH